MLLKEPQRAKNNVGFGGDYIVDSRNWTETQNSSINNYQKSVSLTENV